MLFNSANYVQTSQLALLLLSVGSMVLLLLAMVLIMISLGTDKMMFHWRMWRVQTRGARLLDFHFPDFGLLEHSR